MFHYRSNNLTQLFSCSPSTNQPIMIAVLVRHLGATRKCVFTEGLSPDEVEGFLKVLSPLHSHDECAKKTTPSRSFLLAGGWVRTNHCNLPLHQQISFEHFFNRTERVRPTASRGCLGPVRREQESIHISRRCVQRSRSTPFNRLSSYRGLAPHPKCLHVFWYCFCRFSYH